MTTSIGNHWKGNVYEKSFRYMVLALLRIRLAPKRFARTKERPKSAAERRRPLCTGSISKPIWRRRLRKLFNELATLTRKKFTDDKVAAERHSAIMLQLRRLKKIRPVGTDQSLQPIPSLEEQLRCAVYDAELDADDTSDAQILDMPAYMSEDGDAEEQDVGFLDDESDDETDAEDYDYHLDPYEEDDDNLGSQEDDDGSLDPQEDDDDSLDPQEDQEQEELTTDDGAGEDEHESSGKQIMRLFAVVNTLVHSPRIRHQVNTNYVSKAFSGTTKCTTKELQAVRDVVNLLRPYAPKRVPTNNGYRAHTPCVALRAPMVLLAQAVLQTLGLSSFTRRLSPWPSAGSTVGLQISSGVLFELLCSSKPDQFDIQDLHGNAITNVPNASRPQNKTAVLGSFFNMTLIQQRCRQFRIEFADQYGLDCRILGRIHAWLFYLPVLLEY